MRPESEVELAEMVAGAGGGLRICGGGTRPIGRPFEGQTLSTAGLSGIVLYDPGALTLVARAGTPLSEIESTLAQENQRLAFEPMDHRGIFGSVGDSSIGGVVAGNVSGPRRIQAGACRDYVLGVRFVDGMGQVIKNGGRVMKNVTGYDLAKLMTGCHGTLGVISEVAFKVLPQVEVTASVVLDGLSDARAVQAMARALGSPFEVSGAAHVPVGAAGAVGAAGTEPGDAPPQTFLRLEGFESSVAYRAQQLAHLLAEFGPVEIVTDQAVVLAQWRALRDVALLHDTVGDVWRLSVKPSDAPGVVAQLGAKAMQYDWGGGLIWALLPAGCDARARLQDFAGHATLIRASMDTRRDLAVFHPEPAPLAAISNGLRQKFDPRGILNPGLMG